eukprot:2543343-Rhodomonas_salina.2
MFVTEQRTPQRNAMRLLRTMRGTGVQVHWIVILALLEQCLCALAFGIVQCALPRRLNGIANPHNCRTHSLGSIRCNLQDRAPIVEALVRVADRVKAPFFFPGHQMGRGFPQIF